MYLEVNHVELPTFAQLLHKKNSDLIWFKLLLANNKEVGLFLGLANRPHYKAKTITIW